MLELSVPFRMFIHNDIEVFNEGRLLYLQAVVLIFVFFLAEVIIKELVFLKLMDSKFAVQNFRTFPSSSQITDYDCSEPFEE